MYVFKPLLINSSLTSGYMKLLQFIQNIIYEEGFDGSNPQVLRNFKTFFIIMYVMLFLNSLGLEPEGLRIINSEQAVSKHRGCK